MTFEEYAEGLRDLAAADEVPRAVLSAMSDKDIAAMFRRVGPEGNGVRYTEEQEREAIAKGKTIEDVMAILMDIQLNDEAVQRFNGVIEKEDFVKPDNAAEIATGIWAWRVNGDEKIHLWLSPDTRAKMLDAMTRDMNAARFIFVHINSEVDGEFDGIPLYVCAMLEYAGMKRVQKGLWMAEDCKDAFFDDDFRAVLDKYQEDGRTADDAVDNAMIDSGKRFALIDSLIHGPPRNGPCPCGSGKKYKKCCGGRG